MGATPPPSRPGKELCWASVESAPLPELLRLADGHGFRSVTAQTTVLDDMAALGWTADSIRSLMTDLDVRISYLDGLRSIFPGFPLDEKGKPMSGLSEARVFDVAEELNVTTVNAVHFGGDPSTPLRDIQAALSSSCARARRRGIDLVVEFIPETAIRDLDAAAALVESSGAKVLLDTWHFARAGGSVEMLREHVQLVGALQVSDRTRAQDLQPYVPMTGRLHPGRGELPLAEIVRVVREAHPEMSIGIEVISDEQRQLDSDAAALACEISLEGLLDRAEREP